MSNPVVIVWVSRPPMPKLPTWIGDCECPGREWIMAAMFGGGRCPHCGTGIKFKRIDDWEAPA